MKKQSLVFWGMGGGNLANELMDQFGCCADLVTVSAYIQQRNKLLPSTLETLFHLFVEKSERFSLYKGYRLLAVDELALQIPTDKDDMDYSLIFNNFSIFSCSPS